MLICNKCKKKLDKAKKNNVTKRICVSYSKTEPSFLEVDLCKSCADVLFERVCLVELQFYSERRKDIVVDTSESLP